MSRIQHVLDKAELEGAIRRTRTLGGTGGRDVLPERLSRTSTGAPTAAQLTAERPRRVVAPTLEARLVAQTAPVGSAAEQYRALRTRLGLLDRHGSSQVLLVTSPGPGEGRSLTAANLALTMGQDHERRICILDADLRRPNQHALFGVPQTPGLCDVVLGRAALDDAIVEIGHCDIAMLPAGTVPAHPAELLGTNAVHRVVQALRGRFDCVLVDAPAVAPLADIAILSPLVDAIVVVVRAGQTEKPAIRDAIAALDPARFIGVVLNDIR
ncbi:MAG TPA: CpsD/CapB family tyrosine-protein kinase [Vicinamibacterales bacterium]|jgi:capsular exopolysaccharide synthesis family protein